MAAEAYAGAEDFAVLFPADPAPTPEELAAVSRRIDAATYGRIPAAGGLGALTPFRRELVREAACRLLRYERESADGLGAGVTAYAINGVSLRTGPAPGTCVRGSVLLPGEVRSLLDQTGLTDRSLEARP